MKTAVPMPGSLGRIALVFVVLLVAMSAVGLRATPRQRVLLLGQPHDPAFVEACQCFTFQMRVAFLGDYQLLRNAAVRVHGTSYAVVVGRIVPTKDSAKFTLIDVDYMLPFDAVDPNPLGLLKWLQGQPSVAVVLLVVLAVYGWQFLSLVLGVMMAVIQFFCVALCLDFLALQIGIGLPDSSWALTLAASVLAGWKISQRFDVLLQGNAKSGAASLMIALLFGDVAGLMGLVAGVAVPILSKRIALLFINVAIAFAALQLPNSALRVFTAVIFVLACLDRIFHRVSHVDSSAESVRPA